MGDDGGYCDFDSAFAGLAWVAEKAFAGEVAEDALESRYAAVCAASYRLNVAASGINEVLNPAAVMWDDPLLLMYLQHVRAEDAGALAAAADRYQTIADRIEHDSDDDAAGDIGHAWCLARALAAKARLAHTLIEAYAAEDRDGLTRAFGLITPLREAIESLQESMRRMWLAHNKPFGLEVQQVRLAGLAARTTELERRLRDFLDGEIETIEELDANLPAPPPGGIPGQYRRLATGSCIL